MGNKGVLDSRIEKTPAVVGLYLSDCSREVDPLTYGVEEVSQSVESRKKSQSSRTRKDILANGNRNQRNDALFDDENSARHMKTPQPDWKKAEDINPNIMVIEGDGSQGSNLFCRGTDLVRLNKVGGQGQGTDPTRSRIAKSSESGPPATRINFPNGEYRGDIKETIDEVGISRKMCHGYGTFRYLGGCCYVGQFRMNKRHGNGKFVYENGAIYEGSWINNTPSGVGKYTYPSGMQYFGDFRNGIYEGFGKLYSCGQKKREDRDRNFGPRSRKRGRQIESPGKEKKKEEEVEGEMELQYSGQFSKNMKNGLGIYFYRSKSMYIGEFYKDIRHGLGWILYPQREAEKEEEEDVVSGNEKESDDVAGTGPVGKGKNRRGRGAFKKKKDAKIEFFGWFHEGGKEDSFIRKMLMELRIPTVFSKLIEKLNFKVSMLKDFLVATAKSPLKFNHEDDEKESEESKEEDELWEEDEDDDVIEIIIKDSVQPTNTFSESPSRKKKKKKKKKNSDSREVTELEKILQSIFKQEERVHQILKYILQYRERITNIFDLPDLLEKVDSPFGRECRKVLVRKDILKRKKAVEDEKNKVFSYQVFQD